MDIEQRRCSRLFQPAFIALVCVLHLPGCEHSGPFPETWAAYHEAIARKEWDEALNIADKAISEADNREMRKLRDAAIHAAAADPRYFGSRFSQITERAYDEMDGRGLKEMAWSPSGENIHLFFSKPKYSLAEDDEVFQVLRATTLEEVSRLPTPPWADSVARELWRDTAVAKKVMEHLIDRKFGGKGYFIHPMTEKDATFRIASKELNRPASFAFSLDGALLALGGEVIEESVLLCNLRDKRKVWETLEIGSTAEMERRNQGVRVSHLAFSPNGRFLCSISELGVAIRDVRNGRILHRRPPIGDPRGYARILDVSNAGNKAVILLKNPDKAVFLDFMKEGSPKTIDVGSLRPGLIAARADDAFFAEPDGGSGIDFIDLIAGKTFAHLPIQNVRYFCMAADGRRIAFYHRNGSISVWGVRKP